MSDYSPITKNDTDFNEVKRIQLILLQEILRVCKENSLSIWVDGGSLLGTVREHGYIPWDDDIDLFMLRDDYDKLVGLAPIVFKTPFFFQNGHSDNCYYIGHAQFRYQGTTAIQSSQLKCKFDQSIFIDVFVFDKLPSDGIVPAKTIRKINIYHELLRYKSTFSFELKKPLRSMAFIFAQLFFLFVNYKRFFSKFEDICRNLSKGDSDFYSSPSFTTKQIERNKKRKEWLSETIYMPFENIMVPVPIGYDNILRNLYGNDYMTPRKQPTCHGEVIFDTQRSYVDVLMDIKRGKL